MRPDQRKAILMLIDVFGRDLPAVGVVAQLALSSVLATMQIGVAVLALVRSVGEFEVDMAVAARYGRMTATERESRLRMVELDLILNHLPIRGGVAGNARLVEIAMWTLCRREGSRDLRTGRRQRAQEQ